LHIKIRPKSCHSRESGNPVFMGFFWIPAAVYPSEGWGWNDSQNG
jgi:hypothetical protein